MVRRKCTAAQREGHSKCVGKPLDYRGQTQSHSSFVKAMVKTRKGNYTSPHPSNKPPKPSSGSVRKVKNKVGSPAAKNRPSSLSSPLQQGEHSSDDFEFDKEEDIEEQQEAVASDSSLCSQGSQRQRLPFHLQRTLLSDIQLRGGIDNFGLESEQALSLICDQRPELYGERGDSLRMRIGRKVCHWRIISNKSKTDWFGVLRKFQVTDKPPKDQLLRKGLVPICG